jgi:hydroxyacylglutathione hydrolase
METIGRDELKGMIDAREDFKLVFCLGEGEFSLKHIPGSLCIDRPPVISNIEAVMGHDDNIVVYCSGPDCLASGVAYELMRKHGFQHVRRFVGGIYEWEEAGLPLEGEMVTQDRYDQVGPEAST